MHELIVFSVTFSFVWTHILTDSEGLLWNVPNYYPKVIEHTMFCNVCLSGWICLFFGLYYLGVLIHVPVIEVITSSIGACFMSMFISAFANYLKKYLNGKQ